MGEEKESAPLPDSGFQMLADQLLILEDSLQAPHVQLL
jgi:hypothetical protein